MVFLNRSFDKKRLKALLLWFRLNLSEGAALEAVEILQGLGFRSATQGAISLGLDDLKTPRSKGGRVFQAQLEVSLAYHEHHRGNRTPVELFQHLVDTWHRTSQDLTAEVVQLFHSTERVNPVYMMAFSGARGNLSQVRQLVAMRGLMADPRGQIVGFPILSNFREGLTITEYFVSCYGARKGVVDTAIRTADAGYLTRRLADVSHHFVVRTTNCGTHRTICLRDIKEGEKIILPLVNRLVGRVLGEHIPNKAFRNQEITPDLAPKLASECNQISVRSPLSCSLRWGVCQLCYGWGLSEGRRVTLGEAVGIIAAQSIGEPGTQLTLRTFHTGGVFSGDLLNEIRAPYNGTIFFPKPLQGLLVRTPHGQIAFLTKVSGKMFLLNDVSSLTATDYKYNDYNIDKSSSLQPLHAMDSRQQQNVPLLTNLQLDGKQKQEQSFTSETAALGKHKSKMHKEMEFLVQPSTVIFVRQKEQVHHNQLLAEFSSSTLQPINDQIEVTQQVLSETAGQVWLKEIQYGNRKGSGSGSLGTHFSSQKLGGIWVLSGKPRSNSFVNDRQQFFSNSSRLVSPNLTKNYKQPDLIFKVAVLAPRENNVHRERVVKSIDLASRTQDITKNGALETKSFSQKNIGVGDPNVSHINSSLQNFFLKSFTSSKIQTFLQKRQSVNAKNYKTSVINLEHDHDFLKYHYPLGYLYSANLRFSNLIQPVKPKAAMVANKVISIFLRERCGNQESLDLLVARSDEKLIKTSDNFRFLPVSARHSTYSIDSKHVMTKSMQDKQRGEIFGKKIQTNLITKSKSPADWWFENNCKIAPGLLLAESFFANKEKSQGQLIWLSSNFVQQKKPINVASSFKSLRLLEPSVAQVVQGVDTSLDHENQPSRTYATCATEGCNGFSYIKKVDVQKLSTKNDFAKNHSFPYLGGTQFYKDSQTFSLLVQPQLENNCNAPTNVVGDWHYNYDIGVSTKKVTSQPVKSEQTDNKKIRKKVVSNGQRNQVKAIKQNQLVFHHPLDFLLQARKSQNIPVITNLLKPIPCNRRQFSVTNRVIFSPIKQNYTSEKLTAFLNLKVPQVFPKNKGVASALQLIQLEVTEIVQNINHKPSNVTSPVLCNYYNHCNLRLHKLYKLNKSRFTTVHPKKKKVQSLTNPLQHTAKKAKEIFNRAPRFTTLGCTFPYLPLQPSVAQVPLGAKNKIRSYVSLDFLSFTPFWQPFFLGNYPTKVSKDVKSKNFSYLSNVNSITDFGAPKTLFKPLTVQHNSQNQLYNIAGNQKSKFVCHKKKKGKKQIAFLQKPTWLSVNIGNNNYIDLIKSINLWDKKQPIESTNPLEISNNVSFCNGCASSGQAQSKVQKLVNYIGTQVKRNKEQIKNIHAYMSLPSKRRLFTSCATCATEGCNGCNACTRRGGEAPTTKGYKKDCRKAGKIERNDNSLDQQIIHTITLPLVSFPYIIPVQSKNVNKFKSICYKEQNLTNDYDSRCVTPVQGKRLPLIRQNFWEESFLNEIKKNLTLDFMVTLLGMNDQKVQNNLFAYSPCALHLLVQPVQSLQPSVAQVANNLRLDGKQQEKMQKTEVFATQVCTKKEHKRDTNTIQGNLSKTKSFHIPTILLERLIHLEKQKFNRLNPESLELIIKSNDYVIEKDKIEPIAITKFIDGVTGFMDKVDKDSCDQKMQERKDDGRANCRKNYSTLVDSSDLDKLQKTIQILSISQRKNVTLFTFLSSSKEKIGIEKLNLRVSDINFVASLPIRTITNLQGRHTSTFLKQPRENIVATSCISKKSKLNTICFCSAAAQPSVQQRLWTGKIKRFLLAALATPYTLSDSLKTKHHESKQVVNISQKTSSLGSFTHFLEPLVEHTTLTRLVSLQTIQTSNIFEKKSNLGEEIPQTYSLMRRIVEYPIKRSIFNKLNTNRRNKVKYQPFFTNLVGTTPVLDTFWPKNNSIFSQNIRKILFIRNKIWTGKKKFTSFQQESYLEWYALTSIKEQLSGSFTRLFCDPSSACNQPTIFVSSTVAYGPTPTLRCWKEGVREMHTLRGKHNQAQDPNSMVAHQKENSAQQISAILPVESNVTMMTKYLSLEKHQVNTKNKQVKQSSIPSLGESDQITFIKESKTINKRDSTLLGNNQEKNSSTLWPSSIAISMKKKYNSLQPLETLAETQRGGQHKMLNETITKSKHLFPGQLVAYGEKIDQHVATTESGQVLYVDSKRVTLRKAQTVLLYSQAILSVLSREWITKGTPLMALSYQKLVTGDIVQGLPKIEQFFEAPLLKDGAFWSDSLQAKLNLFFQQHREKLPLADAVRKGFLDIQRVLVEGVQRVYISQGVLIADKHLEVIVRQMTFKGRILYSGDTGFLRNELVALDKIESVNQVTYGQKALYHPQVRGITDASLESESFLSAASFQETTRVLSRDAIIGKSDLMRGLKERVIVGELIQAGTGLANNNIYSLLTNSNT